MCRRLIPPSFGVGYYEPRIDEQARRAVVPAKRAGKNKIKLPNVAAVPVLASGTSSKTTAYGRHHPLFQTRHSYCSLQFDFPTASCNAALMHDDCRSAAVFVLFEGGNGA